MRIVLTKSIEEELVLHLMSHPGRHERGAILFFRKFSDDDSEESARYVLVDFRPFADSEILESSPTSLKFSMRKFPADFFRCESGALTFGFAHCHPNGGVFFSDKDEDCERSLVRAICNHSDEKSELISLLFAEKRWIGRRRSGRAPAESVAASHVTVLGERIQYHAAASSSLHHWNSRQAAAFGAPFNDALQSMRMAVVGLGGTGSPLAQTAVRAGVGELILVDGDVVEATNLNRTQGYRIKDIGTNKAVRSKEFLDEIGLDCNITAIPQFIDASPSAIDRLSTCDVIFGCTDDIIGRNTLNELCYYYCCPYIDVGLSGRIDAPPNRVPQLREHKARITTIMPDSGKCLWCHRVLTHEKLKFAFAVRDRPELAGMDKDKLRREFYLTGGGEGAPGVGPFTASAAQFAFMSFMNLLKPFRETGTGIRPDNLWIDFVSVEMYSNNPKQDTNCYCCGSNGLLNADEGEFRLHTPSLGKR